MIQPRVRMARVVHLARGAGLGLRAAALLAMLVATTAVPLVAQTRFVRAAGPPDFSHYTMPAQCLAAARRVVNTVRWERVRDTLDLGGDEPRPAAAVATARRCLGGRFDVATIDPTDLPTLADVALLAGDDSLAAASAERRLAALAPHDTAARATLLGGLVSFYLHAGPRRREAAFRTLARLDALGPVAAPQRFVAVNQIVAYARAIGDTALQHAMLTRVARLARDSVPLSPLARVVVAASSLVDLAFFEGDPQQPSVDAWLARFRALAGGLLGADTAQLQGILIAKPAAPLEGDVWFNRPASGEPRPRPGAWSLVVRLGHDCGASCFPGYAVLKRLHRRFSPDLDITLVTQTAGYFREGVPPATPAAEAERLREYFLEYAQLPGPLAITATPFERFPAPDLRRRNRVIAHDIHYEGAEDGLLPQGGVPHSPPHAVLVDPKGRIVYASSLDPNSEKMLHLILGTLLHRSEVGGVAR